MGKLSVNSFDIRKGHTLGEYRKFFAVPYDKGKLLSFREDELELMSRKRIYWEIIDEDGRKMYYAIPSRFKPFRPNNHNLPFYQNRKPFGIAMAIVGVCFVSCVSSFYVGKAINKKPDDPVEPVYDNLLDEFEAYIKKGGKPDDGKFTIAQLANVAILKLDKHEKYVTVGRGTNNTFPEYVEVTNSFTKNGKNTLEESISNATKFTSFSFGKRDFLVDGNKVNTYRGRPIDKEHVNWSDELVKSYTKDEYMSEIGKNPASPFLYTISDETVLTNKVTDEYPKGTVHKGQSSCTKEGEGYCINMDLHNTLSVTRYIRRIKYLSNQNVDSFDTVNLKFHVDKDFNLISSTVEEHYTIAAIGFIYLPSHGKMETHYYTKDVPDVPKVTEGFDYSKYPF